MVYYGQDTGHNMQKKIEFKILKIGTKANISDVFDKIISVSL